MKIAYDDFLKRAQSTNLIGEFKKSSQAIFFGKANPESPQPHQDRIKKKPRKESLKKVIVTTEEVQVSFTNKSHLWRLLEKTC